MGKDSVSAFAYHLRYNSPKRRIKTLQDELESKKRELNEKIEQLTYCNYHYRGEKKKKKIIAECSSHDLRRWL